VSARTPGKRKRRINEISIFIESMWRNRKAYTIASLALSVAVASCSSKPYFVAKEEPWRASEELACLSSGYVQENPHLVARASLGAPSSYCGAIRPFRMSATRDGRIALNPPAMLRCPMIPAVEHWISTVVEPAAQYYFRMQPTEIKVAASFACRPMNSIPGGKLSEHGHANALDVSAIKLADGRWITLKSGWRGNSREAGFLRAIHKGACRTFTTVLGPDHDRAHHDHFHFDLARRRSGAVCK
jgi:hypothetical protein